MSPEQHERLLSKLAAGMSRRAIARDERVAYSTVQKWAAIPLAKPAKSKTLSRAVAEMRQAAGDPDEWDEPADLVWRREGERSARAIKKAQLGNTFRWRAPD